MKFEDMNKQQLSNKAVELEQQIDDITVELDGAISLLNKVCEVAKFDNELAQLSKEELESLGLEVPIAVINTAHKANKLQEKLNSYKGMLCAVDYYYQQKEDSDG